ncbi:ParB/RepB/Spo0J family partition protein [Methylocystis echinoides]|uniref:ParB/RepB/Spo0J family partition protein n=1 Tax=Methylocystis echinoides TaxID=29468 RepID=UPI003416865C
MSYAGKLDDVAQLLDQLEGMEAPGSNGAPLDIALSLIEEDPHQPRRAFDPETLSQLSASIQERGVLQPIGVTPAGENGMHRIIFGARRFRAAQLAGRTTIPAFVHHARVADPYDQMIENIQRDDLSAADISAFILSRVQAGEKQKDIAQRLGKDKSYIAMYAAVSQMAATLRDRLATSPIRAVYQLHQTWKKFPQEVEAFCAEHDSFTRAQALVFCSDLTGGAPEIDHSSKTVIGVDRASAEPMTYAESRTSAPSPNGDIIPKTRNASESATGKTSQTPRVASDARSPRLQIRNGERLGWLILDRASPSGRTHGLVCFQDTGGIEDLPLSALRLMELNVRPCPDDAKQRLTCTAASGFSIPKGRSEAERPEAERASK